MGALIWLAIAIGLAIAEFTIMDFSLLMLALAALITAGVAVADIPLWAEVTVFAVSSMLSLALLRQKGSLYATRPSLFAHASKRETLDAMAKNLFSVVASGTVKIPVHSTARLADAQQVQCPDWSGQARRRLAHQRLAGVHGVAVGDHQCVLDPDPTPSG